MTMNLLLLFCLLAAHFLADYTPLSTPAMLAAKKHGRPFHPIFDHGMWQGIVMFLVMVCFGVPLAPLCFLFAAQVWSHALIDTMKGRLTFYFPNTVGNMANKWFWIVMGADQLLHQAVIILMVYSIA